MPRARPSRLVPVRQLAAPKVADPETARAINDVATAVRENELNPALPRSGESGELYFRDTDGTMQPIGIGEEGQILAVVDGRPAWAPASLVFPRDWGTVP